ncbi:transcriptional regulator [Paractinoplanes deccanensis]|uniref:Transcriptional regulator n=1 Tax=Paractinoplanes deccanensis TaxID=113561 RepID=A0ABQ3XYV1_9ACTN|nr:helix-turn-helix transcriptional regulator [Actinoplanes deccanensis]GID72934.1 transcriptional regulator [Actinoplanes deccanensis]
MEPWEFGQAVRRWRDRLVPESVGVPAGGRRRASGLRREELAALTGISVDYLTRLEQGRSTSPSPQVVEALARALRLSGTERELLFRLAGLQPPGRDVVPSHVAPSVHRMLDRLAHTPVVVQDAAYNLVLANRPYDALMGDTTAWRGPQRNGVWRNLVGPPGRAVHTPEEKARFQALLVADLRMTAARYPADRDLKRLIADLTAQSPRFAELWQSPAPVSNADTSRTKTVDHPAVGRITLDCDTLVVAGDDLRITVYTAEPGTEDAEKLALAIALGTQTLVS